MNKQKLSGMDERDKRNWGYASNWGVMIVYAYTFIKLTYYILLIKEKHSSCQRHLSDTD